MSEEEGLVTELTEAAIRHLQFSASTKPIGDYLESRAVQALTQMAGEIERLRGALEQIATHYTIERAHLLKDIARVALEKKS